jgi:NTE family protein
LRPESHIQFAASSAAAVAIGIAMIESKTLSRTGAAPVAKRPPFACIALLLQGGGALGAYQGGVYQALAETQLHPDWVAGISIGAINAAIIAGNPPEQRVERLRAFWDRVTGSPLGRWADPWLGDGMAFAGVGDAAHRLLDQLSAFQAVATGAPGFFEPRMPPPWLFAPGCPESTSFYDTSALIATLEGLVDFDRINSKAMRFSVGAVNVRTGNFVYFDTATHTIRPEHILASGALPPGFPAIEIEGEHYWDGGLVSNTPLQWVVDSEPRQDTLAFQVDLWCSRGKFPRDLTDVAVRQKEIQYSSRTRASTDQLKHMQKIRAALAKVMDDAPEPFRHSDEARLLTEFADRKIYNIVQLIYRAKHYEGHSRDYEFSRLSMADHWRAGRDDAIRALRRKEIFERHNSDEGFRAFDFGWHPHEEAGTCD